MLVSGGLAAPHISNAVLVPGDRQRVKHTRAGELVTRQRKTTIGLFGMWMEEFGLWKRRTWHKTQMTWYRAGWRPCCSATHATALACSFTA